MRPLRLRVEGFSAYRQAVEVDFTDVDFFSLSGATGSGKSSLIDAMVFALFGRVPRLGGNAVAPAITAGADRARVGFDFETDGSVYTAVRMAQRTPAGGATVREARLQRGDQVVADGADDVTMAVEDLLRLRFDDFTKTVVLPQGEFARFLTATKAERQGLLRSLLGLDVYTTMRELAKTRAAVATERAEAASRALDALDLADEDQMESLRVRCQALDSLVETVTSHESRITKGEREVETMTARENQLSDAIRRLDAVAPPTHLEEMETLFAEAQAELNDAEDAQAESIEGVHGVETRLSELPSAETIDRWKKTWLRLDELDRRLADLGSEVLVGRVSDSETALARARSELDEARADLAALQTRHAAHSLAATLEAGEPCPVCLQVVTEVPDREGVTGLVELEDRVADLTERVDGIRLEAETARTELATVVAKRAELATQREQVVADLDGVPDHRGLVEIQATISGLISELETARARHAELATVVKSCRSRLEELAEASRSVGKALTGAQISVADLEPSVSESDDVVVQWKELMLWRNRKIDEVSAQLDEIMTETAELRDRLQAERADLLARLQDADVAVSEPYVVSVTTALHDTRTELGRFEANAIEARSLREVIESATDHASVATALAGHLRANGFEQWLMSGAVADLVAGANQLLGQLSGDGYSLDSDDSGSFSIVDHRNADEIRSVSTLSGGETFLVSLALALSLAETLAAKGGAGLDAIILDEGFGSLDTESLDTVASVLEELTGRGLMVGVITHVKELAARAPVRYEVRREAAGSMVRLVS